MTRGQVLENQSAALLASIPDVRGGWPQHSDIVSIVFTVTSTADDSVTYRASTEGDSSDTETLTLADVLHEEPQEDAIRWHDETGYNLEIIAPGECWPEPGEYMAEAIITTTDAQTLSAQWSVLAKKMYSI